MLVGAKYFPHIWSVLGDLFTLLLELSFWSDLFETTWLFAVGMTFGSLIAILLGALTSFSKTGDLAVSGSLSFIRSIPAVALLPLFIASIGSSSFTVVLLTIYVVTFKLAVYVSRGFQKTAIEIVELLKIVRMSSTRRFVSVYLPHALTSIGTGLRITSVIAYGTVVACGVTAGTPGFGSSLLLAEESASYIRVFSYVIVLGITGLALNSFFTKVEGILESRYGMN